jgi:hypothetical protein
MYGDIAYAASWRSRADAGNRLNGEARGGAWRLKAARNMKYLHYQKYANEAESAHRK